MLERMIFQGHRYKKIIAISELVKQNILTHYHIPESDIEVIYNGVDLERFHPGNRGRYREEIRNKHGISESDFVILFVGSGFERKGLRFLLKAAELIPQRVTVLIAGRGSEKIYNCKGKKQNIIFCGPQKDIHKYYAASDIFVFPTVYEPFGNVHLEALASGLPVITTNQSGAAEIIDNGLHGFVIPSPEDCTAIAERIRFLLENPDQRKSISFNARKRAEEFSYERFLNNILNIYESLAGKK
jgi:UDP-glucose:(heptosyl)LPS alpha-1,3-glucosyltransferase